MDEAVHYYRHDQRFCACGGAWMYKRHTDDAEKVTCPACQGVLALEVEVELDPPDLSGIKQYASTLAGLTSALKYYVGDMGAVQDVVVKESPYRSGYVDVTIKLSIHMMDPLSRRHVEIIAKAVFDELLPLGVVATLKLEEV